uniref:hypothetical protein n=1 Tax=Microbulbifer agarilyticus TaxID=260552 RepID=UPI000255BBEB|nr:hypothetical protein [Microbulbifer agarilyticus]
MTSVLRDDRQVALQWLYRWACETAGHYRFVLDHLENSGAGQVFAVLLAEREQLSERLAEAIRDTGDLPAVPDADKEWAVQLPEQLATTFTEHGEATMRVHCRSLEQGFMQQVQLEAGLLASSEYDSLLQESIRSAEQALAQLAETAPH